MISWKGKDPGQVEDIKTAGKVLEAFGAEGLNGLKSGERKWMGD